jgi:hypothetical protein
MMDTTKLVVGQDVLVQYQKYGRGAEGKVVNVTPDGVEVRTYLGEILEFDRDGWGYHGKHKVECRPPRDVTKLVVGQEVFVVSGGYFSNGKVITVTQEGVEVQLERNPLPGPDNVIWQFDTKGEALNGIGTAECGPYIIDDMSFEERKAELVEIARKRTLLHKKYPDGSIIPADEPLPPIFDGPFW